MSLLILESTLIYVFIIYLLNFKCLVTVTWLINPKTCHHAIQNTVQHNYFITKTINLVFIKVVPIELIGSTSDSYKYTGVIQVKRSILWDVTVTVNVKKKVVRTRVYL